MYSIGEFSRLTTLTVKTLRHYHEKGLLIPAHVEEATSYRFYDKSALERARIIVVLKRLEFSLDDIGQILAECGDDGDALAFLERHQAAIQKKLERYREISRTLKQVVSQEREALQLMENKKDEIEEKNIAPLLIAGIREKGRYDECSERFKKLGRAYGFGIAGSPGNLIFDDEYKEEDADYESFFPVKKAKDVDGVTTRTLDSARCLCLVHKGPYDQIHKTYSVLMDAMREEGLKPGTPSREIYIKGPGMIFKGNPKNYLTEVQIPVFAADD